MPLPEYPLRTIVPIVRLNVGAKKIVEFLGTGFFVQDGLLMSAKHVLGVQLGENERLAVPIADEAATVYLIGDISTSREFDIAIGRLDRPRQAELLSLATNWPPVNAEILTVEYSGTTMLEAGPFFMPYYRKGHVICVYLSRYPEPHPTECLDLSFPALKGASGAPVIVEADGSVCGMIVANVERHLLPAHIERVESTDGTVEERRYFLPTGKAISWPHLRDFLASITKPRK
jgi:hypothetical protein